MARLAISCPIRPNPTIPSVFSLSSTPMNWARFHSPRLTDAFACGILRTMEHIIESVCSQAASVLPDGAFATMMPRLVAASRSILSTPAPALPIYLSLSAAAMTLAVTCVPLLTRSPSYSPIIVISSSSERPVLTSTAQNSCNSATPSSASESLTRTL